jgi:hypothetical protein
VEVEPGLAGEFVLDEALDQDQAEAGLGRVADRRGASFAPDDGGGVRGFFDTDEEDACRGCLSVRVGVEFEVTSVVVLRVRRLSGYLKL